MKYICRTINLSTGTEYRPVGKKTFAADEQPDKIFIPVKTARQFLLGVHNTSILPVSGTGRVRRDNKLRGRSVAQGRCRTGARTGTGPGQSRGAVLQ